MVSTNDDSKRYNSNSRNSIPSVKKATDFKNPLTEEKMKDLFDFVNSRSAKSGSLCYNKI